MSGIKKSDKGHDRFSMQWEWGINKWAEDYEYE